MRHSPATRFTGIFAALVLAGLLTACGGGGTATPAGDSGNSSSSSPGSAPTETATSEAAEPETTESDQGADYAFDVGRDDMVTAIESAFSSDNGSARWEGDTLILSIDGDADGTMAGFTECRVLAELLLETDTSVIEFPNGTVECEELLSGI